MLDPWPHLAPIFRDIGKSHKASGVRECHYVAVGNALVAALEEVLEKRWLPDVRDAWMLFLAHCQGIDCVCFLSIVVVPRFADEK